MAAKAAVAVLAPEVPPHREAWPRQVGKVGVDGGPTKRKFAHRLAFLPDIGLCHVTPFGICSQNDLLYNSRSTAQIHSQRPTLY